MTTTTSTHATAPTSAFISIGGTVWVGDAVVVAAAIPYELFITSARVMPLRTLRTVFDHDNYNMRRVSAQDIWL